MEAALDRWLDPPALPDQSELPDQYGLPSASAPPDAPSTAPDCDIDTQEANPGAPPGRPMLRLADLVAAVRATLLVDVGAVTAQVMAHYDVQAGEEALHTILMCMHASRQDVVQELRDEAIRWRMLGASSTVILDRAFQHFDHTTDEHFDF